MNVMYVDDEEILLEVVRNYFEIMELDADCFSSSRDGLDKMKEKKIDMLLVDYNMPGVSIEDYINEVKKNNKDIKIIVTSGDVQSNIKLDLSEKNHLYFLKKPFTIEELSDKIKEIFPDTNFNSL